MKIDIMTLFPEMINAVMRESIIGRAQDKGLVEVKATNIRDYALDKHHKADDAPYGGGRGPVMLAEPLSLCHEALSGGEHVHTVFLSAQGQPFNQQKARELLAKEHFILVCGHYEGIDQRFIDECVDEEISIGDFVLTGGEIPAMAVADAVCRMVPGVLPDEEAFTAESHWDGLLEHPQTERLSALRPSCQYRGVAARNEPAPHEKGPPRPVREIRAAGQARPEDPRKDPSGRLKTQYPHADSVGISLSIKLTLT